MNRDLVAQATAGPYPVPSLLFGDDGTPTMDLAGPGLTGHAHPEHAADTHDHGSQRAGMLAYLEAAGMYGATASELVQARCADSVPNAGSRLIELRGGTAAFPDRLVARLVDPTTGRLVTRPGPSGRAQAVHVATSVPIPDGWPYRYETPPVVRLCPCCGHALKGQQTARVIDQTGNGLGDPW